VRSARSCRPHGGQSVAGRAWRAERWLHRRPPRSLHAHARVTTECRDLELGHDGIGCSGLSAVSTAAQARRRRISTAFFEEQGLIGASGRSSTIERRIAPLHTARPEILQSPGSRLNRLGSYRPAGDATRSTQRTSVRPSSRPCYCDAGVLRTAAPGAPLRADGCRSAGEAAGFRGGGADGSRSTVETASELNHPPMEGGSESIVRRTVIE
jgi:hypothetical protein